jgi:hypothetical protein
MQNAYKAAVGECITAIKQEKALASRSFGIRGKVKAANKRYETRCEESSMVCARPFSGRPSGTTGNNPLCPVPH